MTYFPLVSKPYAYFEHIGILGGSTGMTPIIVADGSTTFPTPDATRGTAATITNNVCKYATASAVSWVGYNLGATYTKVLIITYTQPTFFTHIETSTLNADDSKDYLGAEVYMATINGGISTRQYKITGTTTFTAITTDTTIFSPRVASQKSTSNIGIATYLQYTGVGDADQKIFLQWGGCNSEWFPVSQTTDETHQGFRSVGLGVQGVDQRFMTPFYVFGAV